MGLELGSEGWHRGEVKRVKGATEGIPGSWHVRNKGRKAGINVLTLQHSETSECGREAGPTVGQRGWEAEMSMNLRQPRWGLWKVLQFMQVLYSTVVFLYHHAAEVPASTKALPIPLTSSSAGQGAFLVLVHFWVELPPAARPPATSLGEFRLWSYFMVFLGRHVKANQPVYLSNEAYFMKL